MIRRRRGARVLTIVCVLSAFACALAASACAIRRQGYFVPVAEALTASSLAAPGTVAPRMFTASDLTAACAAAVPVERLAVEPAVLRGIPGAHIDLQALRIVAIDGADVAVPRLPVAIEAEETTPPVVQLRPDSDDLAGHRLLALAPGTFRLRVRTLCGTPYVEKIIHGTIE